MTADFLDPRRRALLVALTVLDFRYAPGPEPPLLPALRAWLEAGPGSAGSSPAVVGGFGLTHGPVQDGHDFGHGPDVIRDASLHGRGDPE